MVKRFSARVTRRRNFVRLWRDRAGLSQEDLAARIGTSNATISRIENLTQDFNEGHQQAIAQALGCTPFDLLNVNPERVSADDLREYQEAFVNLSPDSRKQVMDLMKLLPKNNDN